MDRIHIRLEQAYEDGGPLSVHVVLNGDTMPGILDIGAFFSIQPEGGCLPLFTCSCGDFGCGGHFVDVLCTSAGLLLRNLYRPDRSLQKACRYHLDWQQVKNTAQEILTILEQIHEHNAQASVTVGHVGPNLLDRLPRYRQSYLLRNNNGTESWIS